MPIGSLDPTFVTNVETLRVHSGVIASALTNSVLREWYLGGPGWSGDPLDIEGIRLAFARDGAGLIYGVSLASPDGSGGDAASAKLQSDYLACLERAFRLRHATPVRCAMHAAARRLGHGTAGVGVFGRIAAYAQDLIVSGASGFVRRKG